MGKLMEYLRIITVEPVMLLFCLVYLVLNGMSQDLIYYKVCSKQYNNSVCSNMDDYSDVQDTVQAQSSYWIMGATLALIIPSTIVSVYLGSWSDKFGKKIPLLLPPIGNVLSLIIYIATSAEYTAPIWLIVLANGVQGFFGSYSGVITTTISYVIAITTESNRTVRVTTLTAMYFVGGIFGPILSGGVVPIIGRTYMFGILLVIQVVNIIYILVFIDNIFPDVIIQNGRQEDNCCKQYFSLAHVKDWCLTPFKKRDGIFRKVILLQIVAVFFVVIAIAAETDIMYLFTVDKPLNWSYSNYSYFMAFKYFTSAIGAFVILPLLKYFCFSDTLLCFLGVISRMGGLVLLGFSYNNAMIICVPVIEMLAAFTVACIRSQLSMLVGPTEKGKIIALEACIENLTSIFVSLVYNSVYPATRYIFHGLLFEITAVMLIIPFIIYCWLLLQDKSKITVVTANISNNSDASELNNSKDNYSSEIKL